MSVALAQTWTSVLAAVGAAGAVGAFVLLLRPADKRVAVYAAIAVFLISAGVVAYLAKEV